MSEAARPRVVLLGASNVARALSPLIATAQNVLECHDGCDVFTAIGRGRSYGGWSKVFGRTLRGILQADLWGALDRAREGQRPTFALLTDIGNDIMYEHPPALIAEWINECIARLKRRDARIVITALPMARIARVKPRQFMLLRNLLFPRCGLRFDEVLARGQEVMRALEELARAEDVPLVHPPDDWYGIDPIHVRFRHYAPAWRAILSHWRPERALEAIPLAKPSTLRWLRLVRALPEEFRILGLNVGRKQPAATLREGTRVWCF